ncbi:TRAP transporter large permease [Pseudovibrio sp. Tun.PSC04-5.I4]|uniref:TRAP transporter large permease n=1 Tax=Pseudovibrio sp. Tun.PSC04-5.I4 TaxID=1798213 RepID=UPI00088CED7F|nr:TRAP transporter large permease [Pseudovibrio sp. Tun.PSC04-5.I4]SDR48883.1 C4-dicarboxylate transporter, DctM subunit [Pseudovibrio sp. Tun.PSC04-5.I4]
METLEIIFVISTFFLLILIHVPIAISLGLSLFLAFWSLELDTIEIAMDAYQALDSFPMLAIPMFVLAGVLMATGGVAQRILDLADEFIGHMPGGLAIVTVFACLLFGGLSGSAPATVAAVGSITIPAMIKQGYAPGFAAGVAACSGVIAIIIPPSNPMIIYSLTQFGTSVSTMFIAGIIPGIVFALSMAVPAYLVSKKHGWGGVREKGTWKTRLVALKRARWAIFTPVVILGGIYSGIFTPTESAAVACLYAFIIGVFVHKDLKFKEVYSVLSQAAIITIVAMFLIPFAVALGKLLTSQAVPELITTIMAESVSGKIGTMLVIIALLIFVGCFMDTLASIIILTPLLYPLVTEFGMNRYQFGIMLIMGLGLGFITPPLGGNLYVANQISRTSVQSVFIGSLPMLLGMFVALLLITFIPLISTIFL